MFNRLSILIARDSPRASRQLCFGMPQQKWAAFTSATTPSNMSSLAGLRRNFGNSSINLVGVEDKKEVKKKTNQWDLPAIDGVEEQPTTLASPESESIEAERKKQLELQKLEDKQKTFESRLDEKALRIFKKRPELRKKMEEMFVEYDPEKGKSLVPKGWRNNKQLEEWQRQNYALTEKLDGQKWRPRKGLSREAIEGIRALKQYSPEMHSGDFARMFKVPTESIRRILKSSWEPTSEELEKINQRWERRGDRIITSIKKKAWEEKQAKIKESEARFREQNLVRESRGLPLLSPHHHNNSKKGNKHDHQTSRIQRNKNRYNRKKSDDNEFKPDRSVSKMMF